MASENSPEDNNEDDSENNLSAFSSFINNLDIDELPKTKDELRTQIFDVACQYYQAIFPKEPNDEFIFALTYLLDNFPEDEDLDDEYFLPRLETLKSRQRAIIDDYNDAYKFLDSTIIKLFWLFEGSLIINAVWDLKNTDIIGFGTNLLLGYFIFLGALAYKNNISVYKPPKNKNPNEF
ncbi:hypothetical protein KC669_03875 [Candidatus Dojkabacteria bacterium]|uniref:Uncharacterized protein n=1 Tax=Candidatus Dojkabacteria bacterium TaxID=2099670 RepID=A0A955RLW1_9BACT|nr:hypothetical protein [Candidatus Dojkabacteria bacterium]